MNKKRIAIFASGSGTNAQNIFDYFDDNEKVVIDSLWANKPNAYALKRAEKYNIDNWVFNRYQFYQTNELLETLRNRKSNIELHNYIKSYGVEFMHQYILTSCYKMLPETKETEKQLDERSQCLDLYLYSVNDSAEVAFTLDQKNTLCTNRSILI